MGVTASPLTWVVRALWLTLPLTCGDLVATTLDGRSGPVRGVAIGLAWAVWAAGLLASLVTQPSALTVLRTLAPLPLMASAVCAVESTPSAIGWLGLATSALVVVVAGSAVVGADFVDGASYGDERRFALRPPAVLLAGPIPLTWALTTLPLPLGALLLAAGRWFAGAVLVVAGAATAWWGFRVLHRLARRCVVFVPAAFVFMTVLAFNIVDTVISVGTLVVAATIGLLEAAESRGVPGVVDAEAAVAHGDRLRGGGGSGSGRAGRGCGEVVAHASSPFI